MSRLTEIKARFAFATSPRPWASIEDCDFANHALTDVKFLLGLTEALQNEVLAMQKKYEVDMERLEGAYQAKCSELAHLIQSKDKS